MSWKAVIDEVLADAPALEGERDEVRWAEDRRLWVLWNFAHTATWAGLCDEGLRLALTRLTHTFTSAQWWIDAYHERKGKSALDLVFALEPALNLSRMNEASQWKYLAEWRPKTRKEREAIAREAAERFRRAIGAALYAGVPLARIVWLATQPVTPLGTTERYVYESVEWVERALYVDAAHAEQCWRKFGEPDEYDAAMWVLAANRMAMQAQFDVWHYSVDEQEENEPKEEARDANSETGNDDSSLTLW